MSTPAKSNRTIDHLRGASEALDNYKNIPTDDLKKSVMEWRIEATKSTTTEVASDHHHHNLHRHCHPHMCTLPQIITWPPYTQEKVPPNLVFLGEMAPVSGITPTLLAREQTFKV